MPTERPSSKERRLREMGALQEISSGRQNNRIAQQSAMIQQLQSLYNLGQESQLGPEKLRAGELANQRAQAELDYLPQEADARLRAQNAQADYYNIRSQQEQRPEIRDIGPYVGPGGELPDWIVPYLPPDMQQAHQQRSAAKAAERAAAIARQEEIARSTPQTAQPPQVPLPFDPLTSGIQAPHLPKIPAWLAAYLPKTSY